MTIWFYCISLMHRSSRGNAFLSFLLFHSKSLLLDVLKVTPAFQTSRDGFFRYRDNPGISPWSTGAANASCFSGGSCIDPVAVCRRDSNLISTLFLGTTRKTHLNMLLRCQRWAGRIQKKNCKPLCFRYRVRNA